jgi:sec-independent protein translocase protein TatC
VTSLKISLYAGFALALPVILWQVWSFLAPAVRERTQQSIGRYVAFATLLFVGGVAFAYRIALPAAVHFLTTYDQHVYDIQIRASSYYSFALLVLLSVGLVFELPIFILALVGLGITSADRLRKSRRVGYFAMAALAVALPGVDPVTTAMEMVPLFILFETSIWLSVLLERRRRLAAAAPQPT